jgi:2-polyprenyl-3-methyl-5-hydroxy-6-metoxy-1,4-benzoquinol methylase
MDNVLIRLSQQDETPRSPITGSRDVFRIGEVRVSDLLLLAERTFGDYSYLFEGVEALGLWQCGDSGVKFFVPTICGDEHFYEMLNKADWYYLSSKPEYAVAARYIGERDLVLDVGCGAGEFATYLPVGAVFRGLERSKSAVARAQAARRDVLDEQLETHSRNHSGTYDVVTSFQVIEHLSDPMAFLRDMVACARESGKVVVATPNDESFVGLAINNLLNMPPHHVTRWTPSALRDVMERAGLAEIIIHTEPLANFHEEWFLDQMLIRAFLNARKAGVPLVRADLWFRIIGKLANIAARWLIRGNVSNHSVAVGHTIMAVGRKL